MIITFTLLFPLNTKIPCCKTFLSIGSHGLSPCLVKKSSDIGVGPRAETDPCLPPASVDHAQGGGRVGGW